ncbi:DUF3613 domain-containing protein [Salinisphaera aquimarina]|uniref:DUF3613 domain-containing protein n=1 Tax=Salinisphaera aquimarina TaxID=2094031 RepID=A0ABV7ET77_9GAMM
MKDQWVAVMLMGACAVAAGSAHAGDVNDIGPTVENALEMQSSGGQAAPTRPMLKDVADRTYERYLESFTYPIPEQFDRDASFSADGNG